MLLELELAPLELVCCSTGVLGEAVISGWSLVGRRRGTGLGFCCDRPGVCVVRRVRLAVCELVCGCGLRVG